MLDLQTKLLKQFVEISATDTNKDQEEQLEKSRICALIAYLSKEKIFILHAATHLLNYLDIFMSS